ncbi:MAG: DUF4129 domain-containing protein [Actinomycetota bacterium]
MPASRARANEVSEAQLRALAGQAIADPQAVEDLREVTSVSGRPVDMERALAGASSEELAARLRTLADEGEIGLFDAAESREAARSITTEERFEAARPPRPFRGLIDRIQGWFDSLALQLPGGYITLWLLIALTIVVAALVVVSRFSGRRSAGHVGGRATDPQKAPLVAGSLGRLAEEAEKRGDYRAAVRLRFKALLLRLEAERSIGYRPSMTSRELRRLVNSPAFDAAVSFFDEVAYGNRVPTSNEVRTTRIQWSTL